MRRILLATDFGSCSVDVLKMAIAVARAFEAQIIPIHVIERMSMFDAPSMMVQNQMGDMLFNLREETSSQGIQVADSILESGSAFNKIMHHAEQLQVNVIMLGAGSVTDEHAHLGATAERLIKYATMPVWLVRPGQTELPKRILCPVDRSDTSGRGLSAAIHLARHFESELTVASVVQHSVGEDGYSLMPREQAKLDFFLEKFDFTGVKWQRALRRGKPAEQIISLVQDNRHDLAVMGTSEKTALNRIFFGSVADQVIKAMPCSLVALKSKGAIIKVEMEVDEIDELSEKFEKGRELLNRGFAHEALDLFKQYLDQDAEAAAVWEWCAKAYDRIGEKERAEDSRRRAEDVRYNRWKAQVEGDIRRNW